MTANDIVQKFLDTNTNGDIIIQNADASAHSNECMRYFTNGHCLGNLLDKTTGKETSTPIVPDEGIILSTGLPRDFNFQNSDSNTHVFGSTYSDADLKDYLNYATYDACYLEFEFKCTSDAYIPRVISSTCLAVMNSSNRFC